MMNNKMPEYKFEIGQTVMLASDLRTRGDRWDVYVPGHRGTIIARGIMESEHTKDEVVYMVHWNDHKRGYNIACELAPLPEPEQANK